MNKYRSANMLVQEKKRTEVPASNIVSWSAIKGKKQLYSDRLRSDSAGGNQGKGEGGRHTLSIERGGGGAARGRWF